MQIHAEAVLTVKCIKFVLFMPIRASCTLKAVQKGKYCRQNSSLEIDVERTPTSMKEKNLCKNRPSKEKSWAETLTAKTECHRFEILGPPPHPSFLWLCFLGS